MRWSILVALALQAAMCGQKGPLYLPDPQPDAAAPAIHGYPPGYPPGTEPAGPARRS